MQISALARSLANWPLGRPDVALHWRTFSPFAWLRARRAAPSASSRQPCTGRASRSPTLARAASKRVAQSEARSARRQPPAREAERKRPASAQAKASAPLEANLRRPEVAPNLQQQEARPSEWRRQSLWVSCAPRGALAGRAAGERARPSSHCVGPKLSES